ncbi:MAG: hypothetical protein DID89_2727546146 [Candidatus Nitrotoga sp. CP45]|nr:MAG: hypothetical protein DID89_2727546146 [Candidatus Nitrotoga sp. CP45]
MKNLVSNIWAVTLFVPAVIPSWLPNFVER